MKTHGLTQKARQLGVLMTHPCTIAPTSPLFFFSTRSAILRLPPLDSPLSRSLSLPSIATNIMTSNQHHTSSSTTNLDAIFKHKKALRSRVKKDLRGMDPIQRSLEDNAIQSNVLEAPWFKTSKRLCAYISCSALREVDTSKVLAEILQIASKDGHTQIGKKLYVPRVEDKNSHMRMLNISSINDLIANSMNILEPASVDGDGIEREDVMHANEPVDLFLLPGLAFDKSGRRLGRGGGYYDTFLTKYQELAKEQKWKPPLLVALSYSLQILDEGDIPVTPSDVPVDALVLPSGVIPITPAALERCS